MLEKITQTQANQNYGCGAVPAGGPGCSYIWLISRLSSSSSRSSCKLAVELLVVACATELVRSAAEPPAGVVPF